MNHHKRLMVGLVGLCVIAGLSSWLIDQPLTSDRAAAEQALAAQPPQAKPGLSRFLAWRKHRGLVVIPPGETPSGHNDLYFSGGALRAFSLAGEAPPDPYGRFGAKLVLAEPGWFYDNQGGGYPKEYWNLYENLIFEGSGAQHNGFRLFRDKGVYWDRCHFRKLGTAISVRDTEGKGRGDNDFGQLRSCWFQWCDVALRLDGFQAVNWDFDACAFTDFKYAFYIRRGGELTVRGSTHVWSPTGTFVYFPKDAFSSAQTRRYTFQHLKCEKLGRLCVIEKTNDKWHSPQVTFRDCNLTGVVEPNRGDVIWIDAQQGEVNIENCNLRYHAPGTKLYVRGNVNIQNTPILGTLPRWEQRKQNAKSSR